VIQSGYVKYHDALEPLLAPIDTVTQHPDNANNGDVDEIIVSIGINGMYHPATAQDSTGFLVRGNHTWLACKELGAEVFPVVRADLDDTTALRILMGDNKIASLAMMDPGGELANLRRLVDLDALVGSGYTTSDIEHLEAVTARPLVPEDFTQPWKTYCFQVPPETAAVFEDLTLEAGGMKERFEYLLRLALQR
jgi:hypothetical protein